MEISLIILNIILLTVVYLASVIAEYVAIELPMIDKLFDRKPFNCKPCLTFHLIWILTALIAVYLNYKELFISGLISAFIIFFDVRKIENNKIIK